MSLKRQSSWLISKKNYHELKSTPKAIIKHDTVIISHDLTEDFAILTQKTYNVYAIIKNPHTRFKKVIELNNINSTKKIKLEISRSRSMTIVEYNLVGVNIESEIVFQSQQFIIEIEKPSSDLPRPVWISFKEHYSEFQDLYWIINCQEKENVTIYFNSDKYKFKDVFEVKVPQFLQIRNILVMLFQINFKSTIRSSIEHVLKCDERLFSDFLDLMRESSNLLLLGHDIDENTTKEEIELILYPERFKNDQWLYIAYQLQIETGLVNYLDKEIKSLIKNFEESGS